MKGQAAITGSIVARSRALFSALPRRDAIGTHWTVTVLVLVAFLMLPVIAVIYLAAQPTNNAWAHLASTVLPTAAAQTAKLTFGMAVVTLLIGTVTAWVVTMYRFPGRDVIDRLLVLPLAMPTYIVAYCYADMFDYAGPVQSFLRQAFNWPTPRDYWFPEIRSEGGAILVMSLVLYPYVYLAARASFVQQSVCVLEVARTLGRTPLGVFWSVALPLARPALAAGAALVIMEGINDLGAVQHLGVQTLSASIYATWLQRSNLGGAAQLATVLLLFVFALLALERIARGRGKTHHTTGRYRAIPFQDLIGWRAGLAVIGCLAPVMAGFVLPVGVLLHYALEDVSLSFDAGFAAAAINSIMLAATTAMVAVALALIVAYGRRVSRNAVTRSAVRIAGLGYALPGTVLAIGILIPIASLDNAIDALARDLFGISTGLIISGSILAVTYAYVIRFLAVGLGGIEAGLDRISVSLDAAARTLGATPLNTLQKVHLPLMLPSLGAASLLVFVDAMKELPATLLLRPFGFETLATHVYAYAALEQIESTALGALTIVVTGLVPLILLHQAVAAGRAGNRSSPR